jgi:hypothetical protein
MLGKEKGGLMTASFQHGALKIRSRQWAFAGIVLVFAACGGDGRRTTDPPGNSSSDCGPSNCQGCCTADGECVTGTTISECGRSGAACQSCAVEQLCGASGCEFDGDRRWEVTAVSANVAQRNGAGETWDAAGGLPDPLVCVTEGGSRMCTSSRADTLTPTWSQPLVQTKAQNLASGIFIEFFDEDLTTNDTICSGTIMVANDNFRASRFGVTCGSLTTIEFGIRRL